MLSDEAIDSITVEEREELSLELAQCNDGMVGCPSRASSSIPGSSPKGWSKALQVCERPDTRSRPDERKRCDSDNGSGVELRGLEPLTPWLQTRYQCTLH